LGSLFGPSSATTITSLTILAPDEAWVPADRWHTCTTAPSTLGTDGNGDAAEYDLACRAGNGDWVTYDDSGTSGPVGAFWLERGSDGKLSGIGGDQSCTADSSAAAIKNSDLGMAVSYFYASDGTPGTLVCFDEQDGLTSTATFTWTYVDTNSSVQATLEIPYIGSRSWSSLYDRWRSDAYMLATTPQN
jgi:hypothetical protein